jgi:hypothetical protein
MDHSLRDTHGANAVERLHEKFQSRESPSSRMKGNSEINSEVPAKSGLRIAKSDF